MEICAAFVQWLWKRVGTKVGQRNSNLIESRIWEMTPIYYVDSLSSRLVNGFAGLVACELAADVLAVDAWLPLFQKALFRPIYFFLV